MTRFHLLLLALLALAVPTGALAQAVASSETQVPAKHGKTWVTLSSPLFTIHYDAAGNMTASGGSLQVRHEDAATPCTPVKALYTTQWGTGNPKNGPTLQLPPGMCTFPASSAALTAAIDTFKFVDDQCWEAGSSHAKGTTERAVLAAAGKYKGPPPHLATGWSGVVDYPQFALNVTYSAIDQEQADVHASVQVTCDKAPCVQWAGPSLPDAVQGHPYSVHLFTGAVSPTTTTATGIPPGLSLSSDGTVSGVPTDAGRFGLDVDMWDHSKCSWHNFGDPAHGTEWGQRLTLVVKDHDPPRVSSFTVSPDTLPSNGGDVVAKIVATDNVAVTSVFLTLKQPDGHVGGGAMPLTSGTTANGTWTMTWTASANGASTPVAYTVTVRVGDKEGNSVQLGPKTITVSGAPTKQDMMKAVQKKP